MKDKIQDRLRSYGRRPHVICKEAADYIDALEAELLKQRRANEAAFNNINAEGVVLFIQHDTLSYLKHMAKKALAKLEKPEPPKSDPGNEKP